MRIASSRLTGPMPVISAVVTGCSNDTPTKLCAARLYTSSGWAFCNRRMLELRSVKSYSTSFSWGCDSMPNSSMRQKLTELVRR